MIAGMDTSKYTDSVWEQEPYSIPHNALSDHTEQYPDVPNQTNGHASLLQRLAEQEEMLAAYRQREQILRRRIARLTSALRGKANAILHAENTMLNQQMQALEQRTSEMTLLHAMDDQLLTCSTVHQVCQIMDNFGWLLFPQQSGVLYLVTNDQTVLEAVAYWGEGFQPQMTIERAHCIALQRGRLIVYRRTTDHTCSHLDQSSPLPHVCIPLLSPGNTCGVLSLWGGPQTPQETMEHWMGLAVMVAQRLTLVLTNIRLRDQLIRLSQQDALTGLYNRRYLDTILVETIRHAQDNQRLMGIIMLDIDHFKNFNDTYGHETGDAMLASMGSFLVLHIRDNDIACRYGGEEFIVLLPDASVEDTRKRAEEFRTGIKQVHISQTTHHSSIQVSLGVACYPQHGTTPDALLRSVDRALYRAKAEGRDRVAVAD